MPGSFRYRSGESIRVGDRLHYVGEPALIEHVLDPDSEDRLNWHLPKGGIVLLTKRGVRLSFEVDDEELGRMEFVMRSEADPDKQWQSTWAGPRDPFVSDYWRHL